MPPPADKAPPAIAVIDPNNIRVDGLPAGSVADVLENYRAVPGIRGLVREALDAHRDGREKAHAGQLQGQAEAHAQALADRDAAHAKAIADRDAARDGDRLVHATALAEARADSDRRREADLEAMAADHAAALAEAADGQRKAVAVRDEQIASLKATVAEQLDLINALGGTELGRKMALEARRKSALETIEKQRRIVEECDADPLMQAKAGDGGSP